MSLFPNKINSGCQKTKSREAFCILKDAREKHYEPKLFLRFQLEERIPQNNFYRKLKAKLDLKFLYELTRPYYGQTGNPSIDPVVFFKLMLVGFLEKITYDRELMRHASLRLDILYFLNYDIDEPLPSHVTLCKTRKLLGKEVFEAVFERVLELCIDAGLVSGHTQNIDTAYVDANASLDRMELKNHLAKVEDQDEEDEDKKPPLKVEGKAEKEREALIRKQQKQSQYKVKRREKFTALEGGKANRKNRRRFFSNTTHTSKTDADARVARKSGKPRMLCFSSLMSVDSACNIITDMKAEHADKKDSRLLIEAVERTKGRLLRHGVLINNINADAGFSSGENYRQMEGWNLTGYIPLHGTYKSEIEGFTYDEKRNVFICSRGKILKQYGGVGKRKSRRYLSLISDCKTCPVGLECKGPKSKQKKIERTIYTREYERMKTRLKSGQGKFMARVRRTTVEPVFGTLMQHYAMRRMNTRGIDSAHKNMLMAAVAYNLKKWLKHACHSYSPAANSVEKTLKKGINSLLFHVFALFYLLTSRSSFQLKPSHLLSLSRY